MSDIIWLRLWSLTIELIQLASRSILNLSRWLELLVTLGLRAWVRLRSILIIHKVSHFILKLWRYRLRHWRSWSSNLGLLLFHIDDRVWFENCVLYWWAWSNRQRLFDTLPAPHPITFNFFIWNEPSCVFFFVYFFAYRSIVSWQDLASLDVCSYGSYGSAGALDIVLPRSIVAIAIV